MDDKNRCDRSGKWARFRFGVVGGLLASPPGKGELKEALTALSNKEWLYNEVPTKFGFSTIERWYYQAKNEKNDPIKVLRRKIRNDLGQQRTLTEPLKQALLQQYATHKSWSYQLHYDNLCALAQKMSLSGVPTYSTVRRFMKSLGLFRLQRHRNPDCLSVQRAEARLMEREVRSFEVKHPNALWHLDFHGCSRQVVTAQGKWFTPQLLGILDDNSRLCCHLQWYSAETAENLIHGLKQAFQKRGLPRALLTDNGSAMIAAETEQGLIDCSIIHETTLPRSPYQNGKQESFWGQVEGRLIAMVERIPNLNMEYLNEITQPWGEMEYNRKVHSETGEEPLKRWLSGKDCGRPCPNSDELRLRFTLMTHRTQRLSDGTISIEGIRYEIPARFKHMSHVTARYARWDLSNVFLWDETQNVPLSQIFPVDKAKNADGQRRMLPQNEVPTTEVTNLPPLLQSLMDKYKATGLTPAYLPQRETE